MTSSTEVLFFIKATDLILQVIYPVIFLLHIHFLTCYLFQSHLTFPFTGLKRERQEDRKKECKRKRQDRRRDSNMSGGGVESYPHYSTLRDQAASL